jgi:ATP-dependent Clp protease ATP-binding subunit ClpA
LRAAARRDREGAPGPVQHPAAGDGPRPLTDHNGKTVDFRNVILIMTTNAGASDMAKRGHRLRRRHQQGGSSARKKMRLEAIDGGESSCSPPEFRNRSRCHRALRLSAWRRGGSPDDVTFEVSRVVDKFVLQLELQLAEDLSMSVR